MDRDTRRDKNKNVTSPDHLSIKRIVTSSLNVGTLYTPVSNGTHSCKEFTVVNSYYAYDH